ISHASPRAAAEILELSSVPVYASHSNCRALRNDPRNIDDGLLAALGRRGGVVGVSFHVPHVKKGGASIKDVAAHMARIEAVAGPWTAAVGADYDGRIRTASGLDDASLLQALPGALAAAGFSDAGIAGAMYKNFLDYWKRT
ncbi:MAG: membrane dipeptidase, partial [Myxococcota bacterium]